MPNNMEFANTLGSNNMQKRHISKDEDDTEISNFANRNMTITSNAKSRAFPKLEVSTNGKGNKITLETKKPFASNEFAANFTVCNPTMSANSKHIVYSVVGEDEHGAYQV